MSVIVIYVGIVNIEDLTSLYFQKTAINVFRLDFEKDVTENKLQNKFDYLKLHKQSTVSMKYTEYVFNIHFQKILI